MNKLPFNLVKKDDDTSIGVIDIYGVIGESFWEQGYTKEQMLADLEVIKNAKMSKIVLNINSLGGSVNDAFSIYDMLVELNVPIVAKLNGFVASAATIIASAADHIEMSENSFFLIHKAMTATMGNSNELENDLDFLKKLDEKILNIYSKKVKREKCEELLEVDNGNGKWLSAEEALEYGFIDSISKKEKKEEEEKEAVNSVELKRLGLPDVFGVVETPETKGFLQNLKDKIFGTPENKTIEKTSETTIIEKETIVETEDPMDPDENETEEEVENTVEEPVLSLVEENDIRITNLEKQVLQLISDLSEVNNRLEVIVNEKNNLQAEKDTLTNTISDMIEEKLVINKRVEELENEPIVEPINLSPEGNKNPIKIENNKISNRLNAWNRLDDAKKYLGQK